MPHFWISSQAYLGSLTASISFSSLCQPTALAQSHHLEEQLLGRQASLSSACSSSSLVVFGGEISGACQCMQHWPSDASNYTTAGKALASCRCCSRELDMRCQARCMHAKVMRTCCLELESSTGVACAHAASLCPTSRLVHFLMPLHLPSPHVPPQWQDAACSDTGRHANSVQCT